MHKLVCIPFHILLKANTAQFSKCSHAVFVPKQFYWHYAGQFWRHRSNNVNFKWNKPKHVTVANHQWPKIEKTSFKKSLRNWSEIYARGCSGALRHLSGEHFVFDTQVPVLSSNTVPVWQLQRKLLWVIGVWHCKFVNVTSVIIQTRKTTRCRVCKGW